MTTLDDQASAPMLGKLIGTWRRFGEIGPVYEVIATAPSVEDQQMMRIRVLESGEELAYPFNHLLDDLRAG